MEWGSDEDEWQILRRTDGMEIQVLGAHTIDHKLQNLQVLNYMMKSERERVSVFYVERHVCAQGDVMSPSPGKAGKKSVSQSAGCHFALQIFASRWHIYRLSSLLSSLLRAVVLLLDASCQPIDFECSTSVINPTTCCCTCLLCKAPGESRSRVSRRTRPCRNVTN